MGSFFWAVTPLLTCGFGAPFTIGFAAARLRSALLALAALLYTVCLVLWMVLDLSKGHDITLQDAVILLAAFTPWMGATIHSFLIRERVFATRASAPTSNQAAVETAEYRRELRRQARELAIRDPSLARELCVGRPDQARQYDDGGLVDMNHAPREVIATVPGMTPELTERIIQARQATGAFVSAEELSISADLPVHLNDELAEYSVYLP